WHRAEQCDHPAINDRPRQHWSRPTVVCGEAQNPPPCPRARRVKSAPGRCPRAIPATIEPAMHLPGERAASLAAPPPREWNPQSVAAHAQLAAEGELEENSGIKLLLAIKGLGLFTIGA